MRSTLRRLKTAGKVGFIASVSALSIGLAGASADDFDIQVYGGLQGAPHSTVSTSDGTEFTAGWEGNSFEMPLYLGARGVWWGAVDSMPDLGLSLDFTHAKVYADDETLASTPGWTHFEFTDGLNLLTLNALYRFPIENTSFTPYVGAGAGINVPHVEVTRPSGITSEYQIGGATLQAQAGIDYRLTDRWSVFAEYKGNYSFVNVDIDNNATLDTNIWTNAVNFGVSFRF
ncbi:outer membrane protein [Gellertiella hungarica]|uniref:Lipid A oxidase n=1 Tax=Gellertiella hungarica TaxID=1572859 RepID=A0A7W6NKG7_9HYPH|nr:outer membrane beta-barrel protein [Gellertiella hungarica]MBB4064282.1 lipid A oxidase [Gellertiella hungarica]